MDYNEVIRNKNRILAITLLICIVLRCIVNAFFTGIVQVIPMGIGGLIFTALLLLLNKRVPPVVMMYAMVVLMSAISIILMIAFPCTTNYLMFFLSILPLGVVGISGRKRIFAGILYFAILSWSMV